MEVVCENCGAKLNVPDEKIPPGGHMAVNCPRCKGKVILDSHRAGPQISSPAKGGGIVPAGLDAGDDYEEAPILDFYEEGARLALVIEGDAGQLEKLRQVIEDLGYVFVPAEDSAQAIKKMRYHHFEVVVLFQAFEGLEPGEGPVLRYLNGLPMSVRRRVFLALIGDGFRTMDRMMAFAMSANLVVNGKDLGRLTSILRQAISDNQEFYKVFMETISGVGKA